jgi:hypothetical protein
MIVADETHVLRRLHELQAWADYIVESLTQDQRYEHGKREMLERVVEKEALREIRELSGSLRDKLHGVTTQLESSRPLQEAMV